MEEIGIAEVLRICSEFLENPEDQQKQEELNDLKQKIIVKKCLPLFQKELAVTKTIYSIQIEGKDVRSGAFSLEISLIFDCLLSYTNITIDTEISVREYAAYDVLLFSGLIEYILSFCKEDFARTEALVRQALAFENINQLLGEMEKIDVRSVEGLAREFKNFTLDIKPEVVKNLAEIMRHNDPIYTRIKDDMIEKAYEEAMRENANENS